MDGDAARVREYVVRIMEEALEAHAHFEPRPAPEAQSRSASGLRQREEAHQATIDLDVSVRGVTGSLDMLLVRREANRPFSREELLVAQACAAQVRMLLTGGSSRDQLEAQAVLEERFRLAREIHDGIAQHLAFLKMRIAWLRRSARGVPVSELENVEGVLETALAEARYAITTLRADPAGTSTADALGSYVAEFAQVSGLSAELEIDDGCPEVRPKARVELLRVVQEALNNVRKHASASRVVVNIHRERGGLGVNITDNGVGFDEVSEISGHFGLDIMRERAESVGGNLSVTTSDSGGTRVSVWVPAIDRAPPERLWSA